MGCSIYSDLFHVVIIHLDLVFWERFDRKLIRDTLSRLLCWDSCFLIDITPNTHSITVWKTGQAHLWLTPSISQISFIITSLLLWLLDRCSSSLLSSISSKLSIHQVTVVIFSQQSSLVWYDPLLSWVGVMWLSWLVMHLSLVESAGRLLFLQTSLCNRCSLRSDMRTKLSWDCLANEQRLRCQVFDML